MSSVLENRISNLKGDRAIWVIFLFFAMISLAVVYSASSALAYRGDTTPFSIMLRQAGYFLAGFLMVLLCYKIPLRLYRRGGDTRNNPPAEDDNNRRHKHTALRDSQDSHRPVPGQGD